jgi:hypothetical protein
MGPLTTNKKDSSNRLWQFPNNQQNRLLQCLSKIFHLHLFCIDNNAMKKKPKWNKLIK